MRTNILWECSALGSTQQMLQGWCAQISNDVDCSCFKFEISQDWCVQKRNSVGDSRIDLERLQDCCVQMKFNASDLQLPSASPKWGHDLSGG